MKDDEKDFLEESLRKEVLKSMDDKLSEKQKKELMEEARVALDFLNKIDEVEIPKENYVIFTDGKEQLLYENGEFYVISTTDSSRMKKKKTKKEATDMYLDYFIKYQLNPILDSKSQAKEKVKETNLKEKNIKPVEHKIEENKVEEKAEPSKNVIEKEEPSL